ncbi:MAG: methionyl-tRNA formyltransferase [Aminobacterium colombiense]|jgi:methionyl-tRNA formyltransferase|uniref:methionyl-tRNA formyltransferase n=1 Tax=Aminobacterium TaxID=81466 RepID=UPI000AC40C69|nr:methionyl-tRNA formyltransferase [Aminobacterium sp. EBM-42]MDD2378346.1 methionyl-tRNA formyltransferase [Aminobacterium colombiense]MDD3767235.1 methionyl-tRNA formyltransferase [Aminobacterium colombiense]MDD4264809.1 methionyl-tRNA formyltransferase [Aminobacterium colombiense]MDD4585068.1 methionyl-tRNA formyltransferase [Aminobacterium colombiense]
MKIWFIGTGSFAAFCLEHLVSKCNMHFDRIITGMPKRGGRGMGERPSYVEETATKLNRSVFRTDKLSKDEELKRVLLESPPHCVIVVDFGQKVQEPFLSTPLWGCLNIHPSILPQYRGAAPIQRALMDGQKATGVTVFRLVEEMDAGPVLGQTQIEIGPDETSGDLFQRLAEEGSNLLKVVVKSCNEGTNITTLQNSKLVTYASKIEKRETQLSWSFDAQRFHNTVRALNPQPGAFIFYKKRRLKIWKTSVCEGTGKPGEVLGFIEGNPLVALQEGAVLLLEVQPEGRRVQSGSEWSRGIRLKKGDNLVE